MVMAIYDQNSFLQGIAVGKSLKGWSCGVGTSVPKCWNDEGEYTYFYIDYHLPISEVSVSLFRLSTRVMCESGEIEVQDIESVDSTTFKVYCDLSKAGNGWVAVTGYNSAWLYYDNGYSVPEYSAIFWVDGQQAWTSGYLEDIGAKTTEAFKLLEKLSVSYPPEVEYTCNDEAAAIPLSCTAVDTLTIDYS